MSLPASLPERPLLRGRIHQVALLASVAGLVWLVRSAGSPTARVAAWVYGCAGILLYLTSSSYHVFARSPRARRIMQRADHSMIYVLIAGTFTPMCLLALSGTGRWWLLGAMWGAALLGIVLKVCALERFRKLGAGLYIGMGWAGLVALPALWHRPGLLAMIFAGGVLYTVGAALFAAGRPRLNPRWFGYHELWHVFGVTAGALLFVCNLSLVRAG